ncbi:ornithine aminotransferase [Flavobacterium noncentrifugens]|uniref:Osmotically-inducible protein OsmY, contains BON domain n=1 Tax=Flavobacterium noncentrifugens TaxID=1128970 RepID=A0A1G8WVE2_9FLAO|nr:BON domain-containing protein [Flavobacterium noncentrifugens]GEP51065.1 ornithine aminotransferase [Flavobacterium noncentrifugens]SDJ82171.1 Osmotically-inducible protein OsmY, contains BON domain [Flavobacterium noncentrifugens]
MKTNEELQKEVVDAINWEPLLQAAEIGVMVKDGIVTLTGSVNSYAKKGEAEQAAKNVSGVKVVVEKIEVILNSQTQKTDQEIAVEIVNAFKWHWDIPDGKVQVKVENGWVSLTGELEWNYQKEAAVKAVSVLIGVKGITNNIMIITLSKDNIEKKGIEDAIKRNGHIDDSGIEVEVLNNTVTLRGIVDSWYQKSESGRIAWKAPGVTKVENDLDVDFEE